MGLNPGFQQVSINGAHSDSISYNIDGIYDSDFFFNAPINIPGELSIEEFKTLNGQYGAQYGQGSAQVNVAIKSGDEFVPRGRVRVYPKRFFQSRQPDVHCQERD